MRRRRPAAAPGPLRRPAGRNPRADPPVVDPIAVSEAFKRGEVIQSWDCPLSLLSKGDWVRFPKSKYEQGECDLAGRVKRIEVEGLSWEVIIQPTGTNSEDLLKYLTSVPDPEIRGHLCRRDCDQRRTSPNLVHLLKLQLIKEGEETTWENNLVAEDELRNLRAAQQEWQREVPGGSKEKKEKKSDSSSEGGKKKKKEKKKQKRREAKEKAKKLGGRAQATKPLEQLYSGTGLDPDPDRRASLRRKIKKKLRKDKESSTSAGSSSSSEADVKGQDVGMLDQRSKIQRIAELAPGVLTGEGLQAMKQNVLQASGTPWSVDDTSLPPLVTQYIRQFCLGKASPPVTRELLTLAAVCDHLLQGRVAESVDVAFQRIKSLELSLSGHSWITSQKVEILARPEAGIASRAEVQVAQREASLDYKAKGSSSSNFDKGGKGKAPGKSKDRDKGKGKDRGRGGNRDEGKKSG